jgi:hypothetical protein
MIRRRTITSYVWNSVSGNKMVILSNCIRNFFRKFELIGNSMQGENPAPDNPQEIKSAGRKSKNLLIENISVFTVQDNIAYIPLPEGHETKLYTMLIQKKPGENDDVGFTCGFYDKSNMTATYSAPCLQAGNLVTGNGIVNSKIGVNHFVCFSPADSRFFDIYNVMYAEGKETTLDYEPYGYFFDVKVTGENLLSNNPNDWQIGKGISWSTYPNDAIMIYSVINSAVNVINLKSSNAYSFVNNSGEIVIKRMIERDSSGKGIKDHNIRSNKYTFVTNQNTTNIILRVEKIDGTELLSTDIEFIKIMLVEGEVNELTPYEPYTEQFVQIALNEPLRGIGEYKDVLTKDGVVRKIHEQTLKKEQISMNEYNWDTKYFRLYVNPDKKIDSSINIHELFSNMFKKFVIYKNNPNVYWIISEEEIRSIGITEADSLQVAYEKIKDFVTTNDIVIQYPIVETTLEPLPESVPAQLQALHTENGTTHVFVDSGEVETGINIEYKYKS